MFDIGKFIERPLKTVLSDMSAADLVKLDRWIIETTLHDEIGCGGWSPDVASGNIDLSSSEDCKMKDAADKLPMNVLNNYYSIGIDAYVAYKFHQARDRYYVFIDNTTP